MTAPSAGEVIVDEVNAADASWAAQKKTRAARAAARRVLDIARPYSAVTGTTRAPIDSAHGRDALCPVLPHGPRGDPPPARDARSRGRRHRRGRRADPDRRRRGDP